MAAPLRLSFRLNRPQRRAFDAIERRRTIFVGFGRGVGKSWFVRFVWYTLIAQWEHKPRVDSLKPLRGVRIVVLMPTLKQFKDVHWADIEAELGSLGPWAFLGAKLDKQSGQITFPGGSSIKPFPASEYNSRTARGMRCDVLSADEYDDVDAAVYDAIAVPWLSEPWSLGIELLSGTPTRGRHGLWYRTLKAGELGEALRSGKITHEQALESVAAKAILEVFEQLPAEDWPATLPRDPVAATLFVLGGFYAFRATYRDAPGMVSPLAVARAKANTNPATFKREWEADPDAGEGIVYPFDERHHVRQPPPLHTFHTFVVGQDHGWVDPGVLLLGGIQGHGNDATLWLLDEWYQSECPNHTWDERAAKWDFATFFPDPSRPDRIADLRRKSLRVGNVDNEIFGGVARVADLLFVREYPDGTRYSRLYVAPPCKNAIREFGLYRRKKLPDGTFDEQPEDKDNHAMDAVRYMAVGAFGKGTTARHVVSGR